MPRRVPDASGPTLCVAVPVDEVMMLALVIDGQCPARPAEALRPVDGAHCGRGTAMPSVGAVGARGVRAARPMADWAAMVSSGMR